MIAYLVVLLLSLWPMMASAQPLLADLPVALSASAPSLRTAAIPLAPQTAEVTVRLRRPTTARPLANWEATGRLQIVLVLTLDGVRYEYRGSTSGGIRQSRFGEAAEYSLVVRPTWGFFNGRHNPPQRLGERSRAAWTAHVELTWLAGVVTSTLSLEATAAPAPLIAFHSSVAFDAATDVIENSGDATVTLTHTNVGTDNLAAFAGQSNTDDPAGNLSTSVTYGSTGMTEQWDAVAETFYGHAGYSLANPATGAQTVTGVLAAVPLSQFLGVITFTGVDQTTPVGTAVTGSGATSPATVTVSDAADDDMIVDNLVAANAPTIGADQTLRNTEDNVGLAFRCRQSTQPGTANDVMSWTFTNNSWLLGAIAFKAAGAAAATSVPQRTMTGVGL